VNQGGAHQQQIKAMEDSSEIAISKQRDEIEALKAELEKSKKLTEDHAAAALTSEEQLAEFKKEREDLYSEILGKPKTHFVNSYKRFCQVFVLLCFCNSRV
jgi:chromosome segregation ATPase